jgi:hypothetical protein
MTHKKIRVHSQKNLLNHTQRATQWNGGWCICSLVSLPLWKWIFVIHPLILVVYFPGKRLNRPPPCTGGFLHFICTQKNIQPPVLEVSYILPKVLPLPQESALALCLSQVPVTPTQSLGCPDHKNSTQLSYLGPCTELTWSSTVPAWAGPFSCIANWLLIWSLLSATEIVDFPSPEATATRLWDESPSEEGDLHGSVGDLKIPDGFPYS